MNNFHEYNSEDVKAFDSTNTAVTQEPDATEESFSKIFKKKLWPLLFLLVPALLLTMYDILVATDVLPVWIYFKHYRVKLLRINESGLMVTFALLFYVVLPLLGIAFAVRKYRELTSKYDVGYHKNLTSGYIRRDEVLDNDAHDDAYQENEAVFFPEQAPVVSSEGDVLEFSYSRAGLSDNTARSLSYGAETVYSDSVTISDMVRGFVEFASGRGLSVPDSAARSLLGAMAASKVLYVLGAKDRKVARRTVKLLAEYFGTEVNIETVRSDVKKPENLSVRMPRDSEFYAETDFLIDVYSANHYKNDIRFAALDNVDTETLGEYFSEYLDGVDVPGRERYATVTRATNPLYYINGNKLRLPSNLWYVIIPNDEKVFNSIPVQAMPISLYGISLNENTTEHNVEYPRISLSKFTNAVRLNREENFISEEHWKRIDMIESYVADKLPFALGNKEIRSIEAYAAVVISAGGSVNEAVDGAIASKLLPALAGCDRESLGAEEAGIYALIDRVFGLDNMPLSHDCLRKLGVA